MSSNKLRLFLAVVVAAAALVGCAGLPLQSGRNASVVADAAESVADAAHMPELLSRSSILLSDALMKTLPDTVRSGRREALKHIIERQLQTAKLASALQDSLQQQALQSNRAHALVKAASALEAPLVQRLRGLQDAVGDDDFATGYNAFILQPQGDRRPARMKQIRALIHDMNIVDLQSAFHMTLLRIMLHVRNTVTRDMPDVQPLDVANKVANNRRILRNELQEQLPPILLYVYRNVGDAALAKYVKMQSSPALAWTNRALVKAVRDTLAQAGERIRKQAASL